MRKVKIVNAIVFKNGNEYQIVTQYGKLNY